MTTSSIHTDRTPPRPHQLTPYDRAIASIKRNVAALNELLGYDTTSYRNPQITFGYIGNLDRDSDHRSWSVFLPHPGRVGTSADSIGGFATGDAEAAWLVASQLAAVVKFARWNAEAVR